jgi:hypothetical protein
MKKVAIIYRDNDLFAKWMGYVKILIETLGYEVMVTVFPKGMEEKEIKQWIINNYKKFRNKIVLKDKTCSFYAVAKEAEAFHEPVDDGISSKDIIGLDELFEQASFMAIFGRNFSELANESKYQKGKFELKEGEYNEKFENALIPTKKCLEILLSSVMKKNLPKKIFISTKYLLSHGPFSSLKKDQEEPPQESFAFAGKVLQEIFSIIGCVVEIVELKWENKKEIDKKGNWVIVDRHNEVFFHNAIKLQLPIGNFYEDLHKYGLIKVSEKNLQRELEEVIKKSFRVDR